MMNNSIYFRNSIIRNIFKRFGGENRNEYRIGSIEDEKIERADLKGDICQYKDTDRNN